MLLKTIEKLTVALGFAAAIAAAVVTLPERPAQSQQATLADPVEQGLSSDNVYIDPAVHAFDKATLEAAAVQGHDIASRRTTVRIAVLKTPPGSTIGHNTRERDLLTRQYAQRVHDELNLGKNPLILLTDRYKMLVVIAPELNADKRRALETEFWTNVGNDKKHPTAALAQLAEQVAGETNRTEYGNTWIMWVIFLVVVGGIAVLIAVALRRKKRELAQLREPIQALRTNVLSGIEYLDNYMDVLPKNNPDSDQVRIYRQAASDKFDQASKIIDRATEASDLHRAQALLDRAQADVEQGRRYLDRATGGTGNIPGDDAMRPQPLPASQAEAEAIPQDQRGVSFFSGQPAPLGSLVPVTITLNGQSRQVLVTPEEADELRQGRMPQVRAFQQGSQWVPWYEYQSYDPYRDYWQYQNSGWGGFGSGVLTGFIGAELLGSMFAPSYGYGSPWAYSTDNAYYQGYADAARQNDMNGWDNGAGGGFGGDSFNNDGGGWGGSSGDATSMSAPDTIFGQSGTDWSGDPSGTDWSGDSGGSDWSGDSGGSDWSGGDSGSDSGGGDSGGGGGDW